MKESTTRFSLSHINLSNLVNLLTSALFFHSLLIFVLGPLFLSPLVALLSPLVLIFLIANRSYYHSAPVLWNNLPSDLRHFAHRVTPSPILNSPVSDLSTSLFLKKLKTCLFLSSLVCIHVGYLRTDIFNIDQASFFYLTHILLSFTVISFTPIKLLFHLCL